MPPATTASAAPRWNPNATHAPAAARPTATARAMSVRRRAQANAAAASDAAVIATVAAKAIWAIVTRSTASGYACEDECDGQSDRRRREQLQGPFKLASIAAEGALLATHPPHRRRQDALRVAQQRGCSGRDHRLDANRLRSREVRREQRQRSPREREPQIPVQAAAEQLEVVGDRDERTRRDEREEPQARVDRGADADRG